MNLDIVIVAYRSGALLPRLYFDLSSMTATPYTIHLEDNTAQNRSLNIVRNELAAKGDGEYIAFLNPDVFVSPAWDAHLLDAACRVGVGVAVAVPVGDRRCTPLWSGLVPDGMELGHPPTEEQMRALAEVAKLSSERPPLRGTPYWCNHAAVMRRTTWETLNGYDERFRFWGADRDFDTRMERVLGLQTVLVRSCPIYHAEGLSLAYACEYGEFDTPAEKAHLDLVRNHLAKGTWPLWHEMSAKERVAVRERAEFQHIGGPRA